MTSGRGVAAMSTRLFNNWIFPLLLTSDCALYRYYIRSREIANEDNGLLSEVGG